MFHCREYEDDRHPNCISEGKVQCSACALGRDGRRQEAFESETSAADYKRAAQNLVTFICELAGEYGCAKEIHDLYHCNDENWFRTEFIESLEQAGITPTFLDYYKPGVR